MSDDSDNGMSGFAGNSGKAGDDSVGGGSFDNSGNYGGYTTGSNTNATTPEQVQTAQTNYTSTDPNNGEWGAGYSSPTQLSDLFSGDFTKKTLSNYTNPEASPGWFEPGSLSYKLGLRPPGTTFDQMTSSETPEEKATRIGLVTGAIGSLGNLVSGAALSMSPIGPALGLAKAYQSYNKDQNVGNAVVNGISGIPGWGSIIGNTASGNYGQALANSLGLSGVNRGLASLAGMGTDYATNKNISPTLGGVVGRYAGNAIGGTTGAAFGTSLGQQFGRNYSLRK